MKNKNFAVGDRVGDNTSRYYDDYSPSKIGPLRYDEDNRPEFGRVIAVLPDGRVMVEWDDENRARYAQYSGPQDPATLAPEDGVRARYSVLEDEFREVEKEIKLKLKEVSKGIQEANRLAKSVGRPLVQMYGLFYNTLYKAMDDAGWHTSSFGC